MSGTATMTPCERARAVALRELEALVARTPCIERMERLSSGHFKLQVALPYLAVGPDLDAPVRREGFGLAVALHAHHPDAAPEVHFLSRHLIFHPAVSPMFAAFCLGHGLWTPDLGIARYLVVHLEAVVGLIEIDTLDALFGDPVCRAAAAHYRRLRETGGLPLATPVFPGAAGIAAIDVGPADRAPAGRTVSDRTVSDRTVSDRTMSDRTMSDRTMSDRTVLDRAMSDRTMLDRAGAPPSIAGALGAVMVRGPRGRRMAMMSDAIPSGAVSATCVLADAGWVDALGADGCASLSWLADRIGAETGVQLVRVDGAPALRVEVRPGGRSPAVAIAERLEPVLRQLELPILSLADARIAATLAAARRGATSHEGSDEHDQHVVG